MTTTPGTFTALRTVFRGAVATDAKEIRSLRARVRIEQRAASDEAPALQSHLAAMRKAARARHLAYCLQKGRRWAEIENNRPQGDPQFSSLVAKAWTEAVASSGGVAEPSDQLREHIQKWL